MMKNLKLAQREMRARQNAIRAAEYEQYKSFCRFEFWPAFFKLCRKHKFSSQQAREMRLRIVFGPRIREALEDARVLRALEGDPAAGFLFRR
jgi:hypothetical protein